MEYTRAIARYVVDFSLDDAPESLVINVKRLLFDWIGVAIRGSITETGIIITEFVRALGGRPEATVIGSSIKAPSIHAAFANGVMSHSIELDDVDRLALFHFSPPVVSAALAVAEQQGCDGKTFLEGITAGCEIMARLAYAINPSHRDRGFHTTATCGTFGAAVAAGKILGLNQKSMISCLGIAGAQSSGLMEFYGESMQKRINPGFAARNGVTAALLAKMNFTGADTILEGSRGFCKATSDIYSLEKITEGLCSKFSIDIEFKPYACARPIHPAIDCALNIREKHKINIDEIEEIVVKRHPTWADYHLIYYPRSFHEAQLSLPFSVAVALIDGEAFIDQYSEKKITDARVLNLARKVKVIADDTLKETVSASMEIVMRDGAKYEFTVNFPKGSVQNPMTDEDLKRKFISLTSKVLSQERVNEILKKVKIIEGIKNINELSNLLGYY
ncbi:MAG: MmgE/PrpD family protein [Candidatus Bathyarchaeia archaeon]